jgi:hypothetical protein
VVLRPTMTPANDPNAVLAANQALIIPDASLMPNTAYAVRVAGTNNGASFVKSFVFSTGAGAAR